MAKIRFRVLDRTGDTMTEVDTKNEAAVKAAMARFKELVKGGHLAYAPGDNGSPGKQVKEFDPTITETIFRPQLIGG